MNTRTMLLIAAGCSLAAGPAPAGTKPCRGPDGRVVDCAKTRKPSPRCKDAMGRFTACPAPGGKHGERVPSRS